MAAVGDLGPGRLVVGVGWPAARPASVSTQTRWPRWTSVLTPEGVSATRCSRGRASLGIADVHASAQLPSQPAAQPLEDARQLAALVARHVRRGTRRAVRLHLGAAGRRDEVAELADERRHPVAQPARRNLPQRQHELALVRTQGDGVSRSCVPLPRFRGLLPAPGERLLVERRRARTCRPAPGGSRPGRSPAGTAASPPAARRAPRCSSPSTCRAPAAISANGTPTTRTPGRSDGSARHHRAVVDDDAARPDHVGRTWRGSAR